MTSKGVLSAVLSRFGSHAHHGSHVVGSSVDVDVVGGFSSLSCILSHAGSVVGASVVNSSSESIWIGLPQTAIHKRKATARQNNFILIEAIQNKQCRKMRKYDNKVHTKSESIFNC